MATSTENKAVVVAAQNALTAAKQTGDAAKIAAAQTALKNAQAAQPQ